VQILTNVILVKSKQVNFKYKILTNVILVKSSLNQLGFVSNFMLHV